MELVLSSVLVVLDHYMEEQARLYHRLYQQQQAKGVQDDDSLYRDAELALCGRRRAQLKAFDIKAKNLLEWCAFHQFLPYLHLDFSHIQTLDLHIVYTPPNASSLSTLSSLLDRERQTITDLVHGCKATLETLRLYVPEDGESALSPLFFFFRL